MTCETARSLPGIVRAEMTTTSPRLHLDLFVLADGHARKRRPRLALRAGGEDHDLVVGVVGRVGVRAGRCSRAMRR